MSHFTVMVQVPNDEVEAMGIEHAVSKRLEPFVEQLERDEDKKYFHFVDESVEYKDRWENEEVDLVRLPDRKPFNGRLVFPWDKEFGFCKGGGFLGIGEPKKDDQWTHAYHMGSSVEHMFPLDAEKFTGKFSDMYEDYETFLKNYCGYEPDEVGYWTNDNAKWDWWQIGGRWKDLLKKKDGTMCNFCQVKDLDNGEQEARMKAGAYFRRYIVARREGTYKKSEDSWGDDSTAFSLGFRDIDAEQEQAQQWAEERKAGTRAEDNHRFEIHLRQDLTEDEAEFCDEFWPYWSGTTTYAVLNPDGEWIAPGEMMMFGVSTDRAEAKVAFIKLFFSAFIDPLPPDTWIVVVDCHI